MRRRLVLLAVAVSLMVALAFVVPLAFLVRDLAADRALSAGDRRSQEIARVIATLAPERGLIEASRAVSLPATGGFATSLILPDGSVVGAELLPGETTLLASSGTAFRAGIGGDQVIYTPVILPDGDALVVRVVVDEAALSEGVHRSWAVLAGVAVVLVALGVVAAEILGRSIVRPVQELAKSAVLLGDGDVSVRLAPAGPEEIRDAGAEFNRLAERITGLLQRERDTAADLSHRLRTPITALRLDLEGLDDSKAVRRVWDDVEILERTVDFLIRHAQSPSTGDEVCDIAEILTDRSAFWAPLAQEQGRDLSLDVLPKVAVVAGARHDLEALVDVLFDNVFSHVGEGLSLAVGLVVDSTAAILTFEDQGPGFSTPEVIDRGASGSSSTGLGLDIVRSTAERVGGRVEIARSDTLGGARIDVLLPLVSAER